MDEYVIFPLTCELEEKINEQDKKINILSNIIEKMETKLDILSKMHDQLMVTVYYIDLQDVLDNAKKMQKLPFKNLSLFNIQSSNKNFLSKKDYNITFQHDTIDTFVMDCDLKFQADKLIIKKIMLPIDSEEIDLSNKIVISKLSFNTQFYNIKKVTMCRLQIKPPRADCREQLYTVIPLRLNDLCRHSFFIEDIEGRSYTDLDKKEISTILNFGKLFKL